MKHPAKLSVDISFEIGTYICFLEQFFIEVFGLCMGVTFDRDRSRFEFQVGH